MEKVFDDHIEELKSQGVKEEWIKGIVLHTSDIFEAGRNKYLESLYDYLEVLCFQTAPPYEKYTVQYKVLGLIDNHQVLFCVWIEEE